jgi:hypothetical protein
MGIYNPFDKVFRIFRPLRTHWRKARCEEVACSHYLLGWQTNVDEASEIGKEQGLYIRYQSGREFTEVRVATVTTFTFRAEQQCFRGHQLPREQDPYFIIKQNHDKQAIEPDRWKEEYNETAHHLNKIRKEG